MITHDIPKYNFNVIDHMLQECMHDRFVLELSLVLKSKMLKKSLYIVNGRSTQPKK